MSLITVISVVTIILAGSSLAGIYKYGRDMSHPFFWLNVAFLFYSFSLIYLASYGPAGAAWLNLGNTLNNFYENLLISSLIILIGKVSIESLGRYIGSVKVVGLKVYEIASQQILFLRFIAFSFCLVGIVYWLLLIIQVNAGSLNILASIGVFKYRIEALAATTLPYHLLYAGSQFWFLSYYITGRSSGALKYIFIVVAFAVMLSTGRLSQSFIFLMVPILFDAFHKNNDLRVRNFASLGLVCLIAIFSLYFYRSYTSFVYIGKPAAFFNDFGLEFIFYALIGKGNFPDPQQLILIYEGLMSGKLTLLWGASYADWFVNALDIGDTQSVGYRILNVYMPDKVGGPTPGLIGEALINFGVFFVFYCMLVGLVVVKYHKWTMSKSSILARYIYFKVLFHFWLLYIKVDSSLILGILWQIVPLSMVWFFLVTINSKKKFR